MAVSADCSSKMVSSSAMDDFGSTSRKLSQPAKQTEAARIAIYVRFFISVRVNLQCQLKPQLETTRLRRCSKVNSNLIFTTIGRCFRIQSGVIRYGKQVIGCYVNPKP